MKITLQNTLTLKEIPAPLFGEIQNRLTLENPKWAENEKMGRWNGKTPRLLTFFEATQNGLTIPRGFIGELLEICDRHGVTLQFEDRRRTLPKVDLVFQGKLRPFQKTALVDVLAHDFGTLQAPTGAGKTVIGLAAISARRQPTLVIVHTKELMHQWRDRAVQFLDLEEAEIGLIGDGKKSIGDHLTIGIVNSVYRITDKIRDHIGHLIVDECHRAPSRTFSEAVTAFDCRYMLGLSATPWRRDGLTKLINWHLGDLAHQVDRKALQEAGHILKAKIVWRETDYQTDVDPSEQYSRMLSELTQDPTRNDLIAHDVAREAANGGGVCLVLTDRKEHASALRGLLAGYGIKTALLTGDTHKKEREAIVERLNRGEVKALCATGQLIGEGFDAKSLSTAFLATPIRFDGRVLQYIGRILRPAPGKDTATVYDYRDQHIGPLVAAAKARARTYQEAGAVQ
jgi:superfamily II DNA or RNA helicase